MTPKRTMHFTLIRELYCQYFTSSNVDKMSANRWTFYRHTIRENCSLIRKFRRYVIGTISRFAIVGCVGFIIDTLSFYFLIEQAQFSIAWSRVLAFFIAMITTWLGGRYFTFKDALRSQVTKQFVKHCGGALLSFSFNFITFQYLLYLQVPVPMAFIMGIGVGTVSNFFIAKKLVFVSP